MSATEVREEQKCGEKDRQIESRDMKKREIRSRQISRASINIIRAFALSRQKNAHVRNTRDRVCTAKTYYIPSATLYTNSVDQTAMK